MALTNYAKDGILGGFSGTEYAVTSQYASLHTANPGETGANEFPNELGYTRMPVSFLAATGRKSENNGDVVFTNLPQRTATHVVVWDAAAGGNPLSVIKLTNDQVINEGDKLRIASQALDIFFNASGTGLTDYAAHLALDATFRGTPLNIAQLYSSIHTADPGETGANEANGTGNGYARLPITFGAASAGVMSNSAALLYTNLPAMLASHTAISDTLTGGSVISRGAYTTSKTINAGGELEIGVAQLTMQIVNAV